VFRDIEVHIQIDIARVNLCICVVDSLDYVYVKGDVKELTCYTYTYYSLFINIIHQTADQYFHFYSE